MANLIASSGDVHNDDKIVYDGEYCYLISADCYYKLYKKNGKGIDQYRDRDRMMVIRECYFDDAIELAKALELYIKNIVRI